MTDHAAAPSLLDVQRHPLSRRIMHWVNALAIIIMIGSGWRIYNTSPVYNTYPLLHWYLEFPVTFSLGGDLSQSEALSNEDGLANALLWHFAAMWVLVVNFAAYLGVGFVSGHFRRDFLPLRPAAVIRDLFAALRFRLDHRLGEYNAVQKVFYWGVIAVVVVMILSGLGIWKPVQLQELTWLFGGYDFAREVHFWGMAAICAFLVVHVALTVLVPKTFIAMVLGEASSRPHGSPHRAEETRR